MQTKIKTKEWPQLLPLPETKEIPTVDCLDGNSMPLRLS
jgi:hypothetical protein